VPAGVTGASRKLHRNRARAPPFFLRDPQALEALSLAVVHTERRKAAFGRRKKAPEQAEGKAEAGFTGMIKASRLGF
jgi:hypothetical protein